MFTGIVKGLGIIQAIEKKSDLHTLHIKIPASQCDHIEIGASISVNGVCLTVVAFSQDIVTFDVIQESLERTNLSSLAVGDRVNIERAARFGDEIGGHLLSGHIYGKAKIANIETLENHSIFTFSFSENEMKYFFPKGYIALDGISLTLVSINSSGEFTTHIIPETLRMTTLGFKKVGDLVNVELDSQTQTIVDTLERLEHNRLTSDSQKKVN